MGNEKGFFVIIPHGEYCLLWEAHFIYFDRRSNKYNNIRSQDGFYSRIVAVTPLVF
jgi:hypothetical protein